MVWQRLPGSKNVYLHSRSGAVAFGKSEHELTPLGTIRRLQAGQFEAFGLDDRLLLNTEGADPRHFPDPVRAASALVVSEPYLIPAPPSTTS